VTEEDAKQKWYPFVRNGNEAGCNRAGVANDDYPVQVCIGSKCMAWRWERQEVIQMDMDGNIKGTTLDGPVSKIDGYCGLGGKP
jgi:hypothetical protein